MDVSDDDFFMSGSSSDEEADDEWTDKSAKYDAPSCLLHLPCYVPSDISCVKLLYCNYSICSDKCI